MTAAGSSGVVVVALVANLAIALAKFAAAAWTGSSAMLSSAIHSLVDTSSQALMLLGPGRAARPSLPETTPERPAGDLCFWSYVVALLLFSMGAGVTIYDGVHSLLEPNPVREPHIGYVVIGLAFLLSGLSSWRLFGELQSRHGGESSMQALRRAQEPAHLTLVVESVAALVGLGLALAGIAATHLMRLPWADGAASIAIGLLLAVVAAIMSLEIRRLIAGAAAGPGTSVASADKPPRESQSTGAAVASPPAPLPHVEAPPPASTDSTATAALTAPTAHAERALDAPPAADPLPRSRTSAAKSHRKGRPRPR